MNRNLLAPFGVLTLGLSLLLFAITGGSVRGLFFCGVLVLLGSGLIFRRKWAALYFSLPLCAHGLAEAFSSIEQVTFPVNLLVMLHGLSLTLPLVVTIRTWKQLTWGTRFF